MKIRKLCLSFALAAAAAWPALLVPTAAVAADTAVTQPRPGWYRNLVEFDAMRALVTVPPSKDLLIVDSRPAARQYDPGHIPGAVNIPDSQFDKLAGQLPADKATRLVFYCGGVECPLSHSSAAKAEKLGYANIAVYAAGMPDWIAQGGPVAVSAAQIRKMVDEKANFVLVDARPKRLADKGMLPTAINIPDSDFDRLKDRLPADKATPLVFYCAGLECVLSDQSAVKARQLGYTAVATYPEGHPQWQALYGSGAASAAAAAPAAAPVTVAALVAGKEKGSVTVASFQQAWRADAASIVLVDVRAAKEFAAGSIKGAINIPLDELEKRISTLPADKPVVFICGTGVRAGEAYDIAKLHRPELAAWFVDAKVAYQQDGSFTMTGS